MRLLSALLLAWALAWPMLAAGIEPPAILLAEVYRNQVDVTKYLVSEKLDGVRAIWDGETLNFRSGRQINAPKWFLDGLPKTPLDGELWIGRGSFERLSGIVRKEIPVDAEWRLVRYMIFELPGAPGSFRERAEAIRQIVRQVNLPWLREIEQFSAVDRNNLQKRMNEVVKAGGEGLMLHRADAPYETGRSDTLLKMKPWDDAEAVVIAHQPGKGKYAGMLVALCMAASSRWVLGSATSSGAIRRQSVPRLTIATAS